MRQVVVPNFFLSIDQGTLGRLWATRDQKTHKGEPTVIHLDDMLYYWANNRDLTSAVEKWLKERGYVWKKMSEQEKWELDLFMRSL